MGALEKINEIVFIPTEINKNCLFTYSFGRYFPSSLASFCPFLRQDLLMREKKLTCKILDKFQHCNTYKLQCPITKRESCTGKVSSCP